MDNRRPVTNRGGERGSPLSVGPVLVHGRYGAPVVVGGQWGGRAGEQEDEVEGRWVSFRSKAKEISNTFSLFHLMHSFLFVRPTTGTTHTYVASRVDVMSNAVSQCSPLAASPRIMAHNPCGRLASPHPLFWMSTCLASCDFETLTRRHTTMTY